jgi:Bacterial mobilisation protein (MobC)
VDKAAETKPRSETRQRTAHVITRLTPAERQQIDEAADKSGLALGSYVRAKLLTGPSPRAVRKPPVDRAALAQVLALLGRVGGNVNQIARKLNYGERQDPRDLEKALRELTEMRDALMVALGRDPA